jgi:hypothetical protein
MKGSEIYAALPAGDKADLEAAIWEHLNAGRYIPPKFMPIATTAKGHTALVWVATDAMIVCD